MEKLSSKMVELQISDRGVGGQRTHNDGRFNDLVRRPDRVLGSPVGCGGI